MQKTLSIALFAMLFVGFSLSPALAYTYEDLERDFEDKRNSIDSFYHEQYIALDAEYSQYKEELFEKIEQNEFLDSEIDAMYEELFAFYDQARAEIDRAFSAELDELDRMFYEEWERISQEENEHYDYDDRVNADGTVNEDYDKYEDYYDEYDSTYDDHDKYKEYDGQHYDAAGNPIYYDDYEKHVNYDDYEDYEEHDEREHFESDPEWPEIQPLAQRIMDIIPMEKIQRLWMSPQHDALVDLIVQETDLTQAQAEKVIAFFERVEDYDADDYQDYREYDYVEPTYVQPQPYDSGEIDRLEQVIREMQSENSSLLNENNRLENEVIRLQAENDSLHDTVASLELQLEQLNAVVMEQIKIIYDWVLGQ